MERTVKRLEHSLQLLVEIEERHLEMTRQHESQLGELQEYRRRIDQNLAEITDKLNGLIGYVDGMRPPPPS